MTFMALTQAAPGRTNFVRWAAKALPVAAFVVFGGLFAHHLAQIETAALAAAFSGISPLQWILSLVLTAASFRAVGTYDVLVHRLLKTDQPETRARWAGIRAVAIAQVAGFGAITSAFVRWRCLPELSAFAIARLSAIVSLSFLVALAVVTAVVLPISGLLPAPPFVLVGGAVALLGLMLLAHLAQRLGWIKNRLDGRTLCALMVATTLDTAFAAAALWVLWPEAISFELLFAAYIVALGAGLVSNAPGGLGAFDLTLLALLPVGDSAAAASAVLAFRITYYLVPAGLALASLLQRRTTQETAPHLLPVPEAALAFQDARLKTLGNTTLLTLPTWAGSAVLGHGDLSLLIRHRIPVYKSGAPLAATLRRKGWAVLRSAEEALVPLAGWTLEGRDKRQLRRHLRTFEDSGHICRETLSFHALAPINTAWIEAHGAERGLTMGRFDPTYLSAQRVFAAFGPDGPVAFISVHTTGNQWTLDLMRHTAEVPGGTMQALIVAAIDAARSEGVPLLSLAAVPSPAPHLPFATHIAERAAGLRRFKQAFAPIWAPRYICAPSPLRLTALAAALAHGVHRPAPLSKQPHTEDEEYSFAQACLVCEAHPSP